MNSIITEHCTTISNQKQKLSAEQLRSIFDLIVIQLKETHGSTTDNYSILINTLKNLSGLILIDPLIINHELLSLIQNYLIELLNNLSKHEIHFNTKDEDLFEEIINFFYKIIKHLKTTKLHQQSLSLFQSWFLNEVFFQTITFVLDNLVTNSYQYKNQEQTMRSLSILIQSIQCFQSDNNQIRDNPNVLLLVEPIIQCLSSSLYIDTLKQLDIKSNNFTSFEEFLLRTIPCYCVWNRGKAQFLIIEQLCQKNIFKSYQDIYDLFLPTIDQWEYSLTESIFYMTALLRYVPYYSLTREYIKTSSNLINSMLIILNTNCLLDNILITTDYNSQTNLTDSAISFIFNLTNDCQYLLLIKENEVFSKEIFLKLKHAKVDRVKLHAFMILAKILNENDIQKLDHIDDLVAVFFDYLNKAVNNPSHTFQDVPLQQLLVSLKAFVQHDEIKEEIVKQNYLEFLIKCSTQEDLHHGSVLQLLLEIIWSLLFNNNIQNLVINKYNDFVIYVKTVLINSDRQGVQAAAKGILWKLENESLMKKQLIDQHDNNILHEKYDIMISYSHTNKDLCHEIYQNLVKLKFRVWLDFENMYGSTLQSMAEAIESSEIVLICMSNSYKQSAYCRSEAEYAFTRQRHIIPLVMEKKYRPDGWLGFLCASKMYVDFTKTDFEHAFQKLISQIQLHQHRKSSITTITNPNKQSLTHDDGTTTSTVNNTHPTNNTDEQPSQVPQLERVMSIENSDYNNRYFEWWTHQDVLNFLQDKNFDILRPLFENEQLFDGHALYILYQQSQSNIESTYHLLNSQLTNINEQSLPYLTYLHFISELHKQVNPIDVRQSLRYLLWTTWKKIYQKFF